MAKKSSVSNENPNGAIIYRGPSMIDGAPIVAIATGLAKKSGNPKTGKMVQTWILREDINPYQAVHTGDDSSVCGDCKHRGQIVDGRNTKRSCYVTVWQAPAWVWKSYQRGIYPDATATLEQTFSKKAVRIGSYGDPAAVPFHVWARVLADTETHTGYTHQWRDFPELAGIVMASADTKAERFAAKMLGFRVFRVTAEDSRADKEKGEFACPASKEVGNVTTCNACRACGGNSSANTADVVITAHGATAKRNFKPDNKITA
jgi:hypothetical protein